MMRAGRSGHNVCVGGEEWWKGDPFPTLREKRWERREVQKKKRFNNKIMTCVDFVIFSLQPCAFLNFGEIIVIRRC